MRGPDPTFNGAARESQRPTLEHVATDAREAETLRPPSAVAARAALSVAEEEVAHAALRWAELQQRGQIPLELQLRYIVELLHALVPLHTNLRLSPELRVHGNVSFENTCIQPDGSVLLAKEPDALEAPHSLRAPELARGELDQQSDIYAVGAMLMQMHATQRDSQRADALSARVQGIARRALSFDPNARWASASEFASELESAAGARLPAKAALFMFARDQQGASTAPPVIPPAPRALTSSRAPELGLALQAALPPLQEETFEHGALAISGIPPSLPQRASRSRRGPVLLAAVSFAAACLGAGAWLWTSQNTEEQSLAEDSNLSSEPEISPRFEETQAPKPPSRDAVAELTPGAASPVLPPAVSALGPGAAPTPSNATSASAGTPAVGGVHSGAAPKRSVGAPTKNTKKSADYEPEGI